ncbi:MAG: hypothetical protein WA817_04255 [Candidatus Acidiferrum sp.]
MTNRLTRPFSVLAVAVFLLPLFASAQGTPSERVYQKSKSEVEKALQVLRPSLGGRLPVLDGFVNTTEPLDGYSRGYYQCSVEVLPASSGGTLVRIKAEVTAWYAGSASAQAGYRVLPSNGRLEADLLDRLQDTLGGAASGRNLPPVTASARGVGTSPSAPPGSAQLPASPAPSSAPNAANPPGRTNSLILPGSTQVSASIENPAPPLNSASSAPPSRTNEDLAALQEKRQKLEQQQKDLSTYVQNLEEIQRNQSHPTDLAVVKRPGTSVMPKPLSSAQALFRADVGDEFPIIEEDGSWVHVQISGESRGWIRRAELDMPSSAGPPRATEQADRSNGPAFHVSREETKPFPGNWEALRGKDVRIVWVEPASTSAPSTADAKRSFAKSVFLKAYREIESASQPVAGIVIVFDSADGGQVSATLATLKGWQAGSLPETTFWKQCAVDPPELLQDSSKTVGGDL